MFSFYPRSQSYYQPSAYHQPSPYARALAQQQQQQRAREAAIAQEMERQRLARSRYFPNGYDYEPESDEEDYYLNPRQRALLEAKRRQEALEQRKQAAARMAHENALKQQACRTPEQQSTPPQSPLRRSVSPPAAETERPASPAPQPQPSSPAPSPERLEEAATKIQTQYRIHRAFRAISALASQFDSLKASFVPPTTIDYQAGAGTVVSVPVPESLPSSSSSSAEGAKLAFTPTNVPLHTYNELLSRLLVALDAVESRGDRGVRERRRAVVRTVEAEAARLEAFWRGVWAAQHEKQEPRVDEEKEEVCTMIVDAEEEGTALPELAAPESDSDVEADLATPPPASPIASPELALPSESEKDVMVDMPVEEKVPEDEFVLV